jgi:hypothetical protein
MRRMIAHADGRGPRDEDDQRLVANEGSVVVKAGSGAERHAVEGLRGSPAAGAEHTAASEASGWLAGRRRPPPGHVHGVWPG